MKNVLSIAGSDPSGGAGIQADLKTMCALGVYGMTAITAVTVQNTIRVFGVQEIEPAVVAGQIDAVFGDFPVDAVKIGMIANAEAMRLVRDCLIRHKATNIVLDPVMMSKSGCRLISREVQRELITLFPIASVVTPNLAEAGALADIAMTVRGDMSEAARNILALGAPAVLVKGGAWHDNCDDYLLTTEGEHWYPGPHIDTPNTHGTGCTLSTAIACHLAHGLPLADAVAAAKKYVTQTIHDALPAGQGVGPLGHLTQLYARAGLRP